MYENLKKLRLSLGMNQETFGAVFGKKKTTYAGYEQGVTDPGSDFWLAVADKYNVSIDWLMGFTDDQKRSKFATPSTLDRKYAALDAHGRRGTAVCFPRKDPKRNEKECYYILGYYLFLSKKKKAQGRDGPGLFSFCKADFQLGGMFFVRQRLHCFFKYFIKFTNRRFDQHSRLQLRNRDALFSKDFNQALQGL